jgi:1-acyl-sn-glycerol-3-phosphate acyltransferase
VEKILKRPRPRVNLRVGRPFRLPEGRAKGEQLRDYTDRVMCAIAALLPEQYHGVYAGHPLIEEMARIVR